MEIQRSVFEPYISSVYAVDTQESSKAGGQNVQGSGDTVSISAEAFALAKQQYLGQAAVDEALEEEKKNSIFALKTEKDAEAEKKDETGALRERFNEYMYNPDGRSRNGSGEVDIEKQIQALEKQIDTLRGQLEDLPKTGASDQGVEVQAESINKNIESISALIGELRQQQTKPATPAESTTAAKSTESAELTGLTTTAKK